MSTLTDAKPIRLGDIAPDFSAPSTQGPIDFHKWLGDSWCVFFSHPKDFTPVCTTELGEAARKSADFKKRGVKVIALSVDSLESHKSWTKDIEETQNVSLDYPIVADEIEDILRNAQEYVDLWRRDYGKNNTPGWV